MRNWQSKRSMMPPWPGMMSPKSLILNARLKPEAKKPPKGPMTLQKFGLCLQCLWPLLIRVIDVNPNLTWRKLTWRKRGSRTAPSRSEGEIERLLFYKKRAIKKLWIAQPLLNLRFLSTSGGQRYPWGHLVGRIPVRWRFQPVRMNSGSFGPSSHWILQTHCKCLNLMNCDGHGLSS